LSLGSSSVVFEGKVVKLEKSLIPNVVIANIDCGNCLVRLDLTKQLLVFNEGDKVRILISREKPDYIFGKDFVGWGYVVGTKEGEAGKRKLIISIWGYLLIVETTDESLVSSFSPMDKVYVKISRES